MKKLISLILALSLVLSSTLIANATVFTAADCATAEYVEVPAEVIDNSTANTGITSEFKSGTLSIDDFHFVPYVEVPANDLSSSRSTYASYVRLEFDGCTSNEIYSNKAEYVVRKGESLTVDINTCVWAPETNDIEIGVFNVTYATFESKEFSGGSTGDYPPITFSNLSAGTYWVYVRNLGSRTLTTGYILYNVS